MSITTFSKELRKAYLSTTVPGTSGGGYSLKKDIDTGLQTIVSAMAVLKGTSHTAGESPAFIKVDYGGTDGLVDLYVFDDAGASASGDASVEIQAIGT